MTQSLAVGVTTNTNPHYRICLVRDELPMTGGNGEFGNNLRLFAESLTAAGYDVTLLDLSVVAHHKGGRQGLTDWCTERNVKFLTLPENFKPSLFASRPVAKSYQAFQWLKDCDFDIINFDASSGAAFYSVVAKHQGLSFPKTKLVVNASYSKLESRSREGGYVDSCELLELDHMERESLRLADIVVAPNTESLDWFTDNGWILSSNACVLAPEGVMGGLPCWCSNFDSKAVTSPQDNEQPLVSICITHFNREHYLRQALNSIEAQDYRKIEVVLVDDASTEPGAIDYICSLESSFRERGWTLIQNQEELFTGAARNLAARHAKGEYILFMDDDNVAKPHELSTFVRVARRTKADIISCALDVFSGSNAPDLSANLTGRHIFLGAAVAAGFFRNHFGDTNSLFRRDVFRKLGGFHERKKVGFEDWKIIGDAVLRGYHLEAIPEALVWYRRDNAGRNATVTNSNHAGHLERIKPYLETVPPALRNLLLYAQGINLRQLLQKDNAATKQYIEQTVRWRSKLEAGIALMRYNPMQAVDMMFQGIRAAEACDNPQTLLVSILNTAPRLAQIDKAKAKNLILHAIKTAEQFELTHEKQTAEQLLNALDAPFPANESWGLNSTSVPASLQSR